MNIAFFKNQLVYSLLVMTIFYTGNIYAIHYKVYMIPAVVISTIAIIHAGKTHEAQIFTIKNYFVLKFIKRAISILFLMSGMSIGYLAVSW